MMVMLEDLATLEGISVVDTSCGSRFGGHLDGSCCSGLDLGFLPHGGHSCGYCQFGRALRWWTLARNPLWVPGVPRIPPLAVMWGIRAWPGVWKGARLCTAGRQPFEGLRLGAGGISVRHKWALLSHHGTQSVGALIFMAV